jgi:hypothetical protein
MSYTDSGSWTQGWKLVLGLVIFFGILSVVFGRSHHADAEDVAAALASNPRIHETETALRELYPREHAQLVALLSDTIRQGGNSVTVAADSSTFIDALLRRKSYAIANSPDPEIRAMAEADLAVVRSLQGSDTRLCADFVGNGIAADARPSDEVEALLDHMTALRLRAAHLGENSRQPPRAGPSREDRSAWLARMTASDPASAALLRSGQMSHSTPAQRCTAGILLYRAALDLPAGQSERVIANFYRSDATG